MPPTVSQSLAVSQSVAAAPSPAVSPAVQAARAEGVLRLADAVALFGRSLVRRELASGRWRRAHRRVVVRHNGPLPPRQRLWVALLAGSLGAALGGWSALAFDGMPEGFDAVPTVLIPQGARRPAIDGARVAFSRALGEVDVAPMRHPRRTRPHRSLVDAASASSSAAAARLVLLKGVQQGVATSTQLAEMLARRGQCSHLAVMLETVADLDGGPGSIPEREFARLLRRAGLPQPTRQSVALRPAGRAYLDARWESTDVAAEVDGAHHALAEQRDADWGRHNDLTATGLRVLHFTSFAVRHRPNSVAEVVRRALG